MSLDFSTERWESVKHNYARWWSGELDRPLLYLTLPGRDPGRPEPAQHDMGFITYYPDELPAETIVDRWDYALSGTYFLGDAFPVAGPNAGPGVAAAFAGAKIVNHEGLVWFHPDQPREIGELTLTFNPESRWFRRLADIYRAGNERWQGMVQQAMTDLGGTLDILSTFRPGEQLLMDLYDDPDAVKRVTWEAHQLWYDAFDAFNTILQPVNPGYGSWTPIFCAEPYYMLQCDFAFMLGPEMFAEFVTPELAQTCKKITHGFYHLDGVGQIPHLEQLLSIPELKGIQWVPGDGQPGQAEWPEIYRKTRAAGKLIQIYGWPQDNGLEVLDRVAEACGSAEGIIYVGGATCREQAEHYLKKYGVTA